MTPRLLVLGAGGQVGQEALLAAQAVGIHAVGLDRAALDVTDRSAVRSAVRAFGGAGEGGAVLNTAAYTAVDRAEAEPDAAAAVNRDGAAWVAEACAQTGLPLVHVSTDYVFDGTKGTPYTPDDPVAPLGVYGRTKADGEAAVRDALDRHLIVRTAWVVSARGHNFLRTMHRLAGERERLTVVADQHGHPTPADALAAHLVALAVRAGSGEALPWGTVHLAGTPLATWHELATSVVEAARALGPVRTREVEPIPTSAYPTPAARPPRVELEMHAAHTLGLAPIDWRAGVARAVATLGPVAVDGA